MMRVLLEGSLEIHEEREEQADTRGGFPEGSINQGWTEEQDDITG